MTLFHRISGRGLIAYAHDIVMAGLSFVIALTLRMSGESTAPSDELIIGGAVVMATIAAIAFWMAGLYRGVWRYASMDDLMAITKAVTLTILAFVAVMFVWTRMDDLPRSVPFINWFVLMALLGAPRFIYRFWKDRRIDFSSSASENQIPVLLIGASDGADQFIRSLRQSSDARYAPVGILSEYPQRVGRTIRGVDVLGTIDDLERLTASLRTNGVAPSRLVLTKDEIKGTAVRDLLERSSQLGMSLARIPKLTDFQDAESNGVEMKPVAIEDLLGRPQTPLDREAMRTLIKDRKVLVTGGGGSIGAELVRQVAAFEPNEMYLVENNEYALYQIDREIGDAFPELPRSAIIADARDRHRIFNVFETFHPDLVFHAAALKHVPLVEANPSEGVLTNIGGTKNIADACRAHGVKTMVQVSTDKAVNPTSVMGATKRAAEMYCQSLDLDPIAAASCRFVTVRFGNVLGSTGSVVPLFQKQLSRGGPLTVTDPNMVRYFMTIREAVELILEASAIGSTDTATDGRIFVLDMGEPVKIVDLARQMIRLSGKEPGKDIEIVFTGARPGEKLYEEVLHDGETTIKTEHEGLLLAAPRITAHATLEKVFDAMLTDATEGNNASVCDALHALIPEYTTPDGHQDRQEQTTA